MTPEERAEKEKRLRLLQLQEEELVLMEQEKSEIEKDQAGPQEDPSLLETAAKGIDVYGGAASTRAAVGKVLEGEPGEAIPAAISAYGDPEAVVPSGAELAEKVGFSTERPGVVLKKGDYLVRAPVSQDIQGVSPAEVAGIGIEAALDPTALIGKGVKAAATIVKPIRVALRNASSKRAAKALSMVGEVDPDKQDLLMMGNKIVEEDIIPLLKNPLEMRDKIIGKKQYKTYDDFGRFSYSQKKGRSGGLISQIAKEQDDVIKQLSPQVGKINIREEVLDQIQGKEILKQLDIQDATPMSEKALDKIEEIFNKYSKSFYSSDRSLYDLQKLKQSIGKRLKSDDFKGPLDELKSVEKQVLRQMNLEMRDTIALYANQAETVLDGTPVSGGNFYLIQNQRMEQLHNIADVLETASKKQLQDPDTLTKMLAAGAAASVGGMAAMSSGFGTGLGMMMATTGGVWGATRLARDITMGAIPRMSARMIQKAPDIVERMSQLQAGVRMAPQVSNLYIPRDTAAVLDDPGAVVSILEREAPDMLVDFQKSMSSPRRAEQFLDMMMKFRPDLFEPGQHESLRDGKIIDPVEKSMHRESIMEGEELSMADKIRMIHQFNKTGMPS